MTLPLSLIIDPEHLDAEHGRYSEHDYGTPAPDRDLREPGVPTVQLTIDGLPVSVVEGTSVMRAAALCGVDVPKLCSTDRLDPFGSCRLCLVEVPNVTTGESSGQSRASGCRKFFAHLKRRTSGGALRWTTVGSRCGM